MNDVFDPGFNHAEQSLRVVDIIEIRGQTRGLNLTHETRDGIINHSRGKVILLGRNKQPAATREGAVLAVCDAIAYINHDIDDAVRAGVLSLDDLPKAAIALLGRTPSKRINAMATGLIEGSQNGDITMTSDVREATQELRAYMYQHVYQCDAIDGEITKAKKLIHEMYFYLLDHPLPEIDNGVPGDSLERRTVDFIAGMTDNFAMQLYQKLFFPSTWQS